MPTLYKPGPKGTESEDKIFLLDYVKQTIQRSPFYDSIIEKKAANWEFERLALMDLLLLRMGMAEIFDFPTIPLKVTLNEIIELAKHFSSPRSSVFINGILDRTISEGLKDKTIVKTGRGLIGN
jgi:N utilization substance protein B